MNKRWRWIAIIGVFTAAIFILLAFKPWEGYAKALSEDAVKEALLAQYPGTVHESLKKGNHYRLELETEQGLYEVEVSAHSGDVISLHQLKAFPNEIGVVHGKPNVPNASATPTPTPEPVVTSVPTQTVTPTPTATPTPTKPAATNNKATDKPSTKPTKKPNNQSNSHNYTSKPSKKPPVNVKMISKDQAGKLAAAHVHGKVEDVDLKKSKGDVKYYLVEVDVKDRGDAIVQVNAISGAIMSVVWEDEDED